MENSHEVFVAGFNRLYADLNKKRKASGKTKLTKTKIAEKINVDLAHLSGFLNFHRNFKDPRREAIANTLGVSYVDVLNVGRSELYGATESTTPAPVKPAPAPPQPQSLQEEYDKKHAIIVKGFRNKERGIDINKDLVELEGLDEDELEEIHALIKAKLNKLRKKAGPGNDPKKNGTLDE